MQPKQRNTTGCQARRHLFDFPPLTSGLKAYPSVLASHGGSPSHEAHGPGFPRNYNGEGQVAEKLRDPNKEAKLDLWKNLHMGWLRGLNVINVKHPAQSIEIVSSFQSHICARPGHTKFPLCHISKFGSPSSNCDWFYKGPGGSNKKERVSRFQIG